MADFNSCILLFSNLPPINVDWCLEQAVNMFQVTPLSERFFTHSKTEDQAAIDEMQEELSPRITLNEITQTAIQMVLLDIRTEEE